MENGFSQLHLSATLINNLESLGYHTMTPIQEQCLPDVLKGKDLIAQAQTGSGKTAAFALGIVNKVQPESKVIQSLILCPTRELAEQVAQEVRRIARCIPNVKV